MAGPFQHVPVMLAYVVRLLTCFAMSSSPENTATSVLAILDFLLLVFYLSFPCLHMGCADAAVCGDRPVSTCSRNAGTCYEGPDVLCCVGIDKNTAPSVFVFLD